MLQFYAGSVDTRLICRKDFPINRGEASFVKLLLTTIITTGTMGRRGTETFDRSGAAPRVFGAPRSLNLMRRALLWLWLWLWVLVQSCSAFAQAPFYTDDTGVADAGMLHVEASDEIDALQSMQYPDLRQNTATLKTNVGLPHGLELDLDFPYIAIDRSSVTSSSRGIGDTNLGVKWRIREGSAASHSPALAASFYTEFPTGDSRQNLGSGLIDYWLNLIAQVPASERMRITVNLGILFAGNTSTGVVGIETTRGHVYTGGLSVLYDVNSRLTVGGEVYGGIADTVALDRTQLQSMVGAQYAVREGISLYVGVLAGAYTASPRLGGVLGVAVDFPHMFDAPPLRGSQRSVRTPWEVRSGSSLPSTASLHDP
jgi:hypothetical protein